MKNTQEKIKDEIKKRIEQGREKILWLEGQIKNKENQAKFMAELKKAKAKLEILKKKYSEQEKKVVAYAKKNPKKALVIAAAAGLVAGALLSAFRKKK